VIDALRLQRAAKMKAHGLRGRIEIDFVLFDERDRGDADCGWPRHRDFAEFRETEYANRRPALVLQVYGQECLEYFDMCEMVTCILRNDFAPMRSRGRCLWSTHEPEVRRVEIGADEKLVADMIDIVDDAWPSRLDDLQFFRRLIGW